MALIGVHIDLTVTNTCILSLCPCIDIVVILSGVADLS